jgi:hypothetical protein
LEVVTSGGSAPWNPKRTGLGAVVAMQHYYDYHANRKLFRVSDHALVVYQGRSIVGVKHREVSPWLIWNTEHLRWDKAVPSEARDFEQLPLVGHLDD